MKNCKYLLPCGICEKLGTRCHENEAESTAINPEDVQKDTEYQEMMNWLSSSTTADFLNLSVKND